MSRGLWICVLLMMVGVVFFNVAMSLRVQVSTRGEWFQYLGCLWIGLFLSCSPIIYLLCSLHLLDLLSGIILLFDVCMMPVVEFVGLHDILAWVVFIFFPSLAILFIRRKLKGRFLHK